MVRGGPRQPEPGCRGLGPEEGHLVSSAFQATAKKGGCPSAGAGLSGRDGLAGPGWEAPVPYPVPQGPCRRRCPHSPVSLSPAWRQHRQRQHLQGGLLRGHQQVSPGAPGPVFLLHQLTSFPMSLAPVYLYKLDTEHTSRGLPLAVHWLRLLYFSAEEHGSLSLIKELDPLPQSMA